MRLVSITIRQFRNFVDEQHIKIEEDVTCLVGKNEAGKTTILKALHRLNPATTSDGDFNLTLEYPRWRLARDRRDNANLAAEVAPIEALFLMQEEDWAALVTTLPRVSGDVHVRLRKFYDNETELSFECEWTTALRSAASEVALTSEDVEELTDVTDVAELKAQVKILADRATEAGNPARAKALKELPKAVDRLTFLFEPDEIGETAEAEIRKRIPKFFYFSQYNSLPGTCDLTELAAKLSASKRLTAAENTVVALLEHAGEKPEDFLDEDYDSRKAELQAAGTDLSQRAFEYWRQNPDLSVVFDTDNVVTPNPEDPQAQVARRILKIELRDARHGGVETNFSTRSSGFQWFFSFFAAFSRYQNSTQPVIVLLDEPGTSLHGEAQKDFVRFIYDELGTKKQTLYTTHSQHMVDPAKYEKLRAVHDRATRENPNLGVVVSPISLSGDRETILPVESALGYTVSQHLFLGSGHHLAVEGSSDFVFIQRLGEHLEHLGRTGLDARLAIIPVGGADSMPAFVAILGRRLKVSALIDGMKTSQKRDRVVKAAIANGVPESSVVCCSDVDGMPTNADIEDLFVVDDYLRLYNWAFNTTLTSGDLPETTEPILRKLETVRGDKFDHALPAHALSEHRQEFLAAVLPQTLDHFEDLIQRLNSTLD